MLFRNCWYLLDSSKLYLHMSLQTPFFLRIFVADGDLNGLRIIEKSSGKAQVFTYARGAMASYISCRGYT
jgi:hypothetical protein